MIHNIWIFYHEFFRDWKLLNYNADNILEHFTKLVVIYFVDHNFREKLKQIVWEIAEALLVIYFISHMYKYICTNSVFLPG